MVIPEKGAQELDHYQFHNVVSSILTYSEYYHSVRLNTHAVSIPQQNFTIIVRRKSVANECVFKFTYKIHKMHVWNDFEIA